MNDPGPPVGEEDGVHLEATAHGSAAVNQAGRDLHIHYGPGVRRVEPSEAALDARCPYPGLSAFTVEQAGWFFGRDQLTAHLLARLNTCLTVGGPLMVVAVSGAGKSSLLRAGLLHRVSQGGLTAPGSRYWPQIVFTPGAHPLRAAAAALLTALPGKMTDSSLPADPDPADLDSLLQQLVEASAGPLGTSARVLIVADQFEELFSLCGSEAERTAFISWLWQAADHDRPGGPLALVTCGLRADFYGQCTRYPQLRQALQASQVLVGSMSPGELRQAITGPARTTGLDIEPGLAEILLKDLRTSRPAAPEGDADAAADYDAGRLPLLAHALQVTWQQRHGNTLTLDGYQASGGIDHAIADTAEHVFGLLDKPGQHQARVLFLRLAKIGNTGEDARRPVSLSDLGSGHLRTVADAYTACRLLTRGRDGIQITHEALLHAWPRLRGWLDDDRAGNLVRQDIEETAADWGRSPGDSSLLFRGARLQTATVWASSHDHELSETARHFLMASRRISRRTTILRRSAATALAVLALVASTSSVIALQQRSTAILQRNLAISNQILAVVNQIAAANPSLAAQLLLQAYRTHPSPNLASRLISTENEPLAMPITGTDTGTGSGNSVAFAPNGRILASSGSRTTSLWDVADPEHPRQLGQALATGAVFSMVFSPNGRILASNTGTAIRLWDVADPEHPRRLGQPLSGNPNQSIGLDSVAFSPDGGILASGIDSDMDSKGMIVLWDMTDPHHPHQFSKTPATSRPTDVTSVAFSPDGHTLASGSDSGIYRNGGTIRLWNVTDPHHPRQLSQTSAASRPIDVNSVAFSPDGHTLASGSYNSDSDDSRIRLWNVTDPHHPHQLSQTPAIASAVESVAFSPDGHTLASGSYSSHDGRIRLWDVADPSAPHQLGQPLAITTSTVKSVAFSPDGHTLATGSADGTIRLWSLPRTLTAVTDGANSVAFSPSGQILATGSDGTIELWTATDPQRPRELSQPLNTNRDTSVDSLAFSPDGHTLASGIDDGRRGAIRLWDVTDPQRPQLLSQPPTTAVVSVTFSPDGRTLATGKVNGNGPGLNTSTIILWDVADRRHPHQISQLPAASNVVYSLAFSQNGQLLADGSGGEPIGGTIRLWNVADPRRPHKLGRALTSSSVISLVFSPDGHMLASGGGNDNTIDTIRLWNVANPRHLRPRGRPLATSRATIVESVAFSPDGHTLASGNDDGKIRLWEITDPQHPHQLSQPLAITTSAVGSVAFSPDGHTLAAGSDDGTIQLWNLDVRYAINRICATTKITRQQWRQYVPQLPFEPPCLQ